MTNHCETCQGNGEIVTDWDRYLGETDDVGDGGYLDCPDCDGTGECDTMPADDSPVPATGPDQALNEGIEVDPHKIDLEAARAERIAFASTGDDGKERHTDLAVYYLHQPPSSGRRWLSEAIGQSNVPGERPRMRRLNVGSLERALKLFEDSDIGVMVCEQARDWAETAERCKIADIPVLVTDWDKLLDDEGIVSSIHRFGDRTDGPALIVTENRDQPSTIGHTWLEASDVWDSVRTSDTEALAWLYGEVDSTPRATFAAMLAKDFDLAPRTVTTALKENTPIRVPLRSILRFVDRGAFRAWRAANREKGNA